MGTRDLLPPRCAERFEVTGPLGKGGAGMVYRAIQVELDRPVAVKLLHREVLAEAALVERFKFEARITAALNHPSIVRILDHDVENGVPWIAYELLPGPTLRQHLAPGPLPWQEAFTIAIQVAGALDVAHAAGVLHRDVKPDNVLGAGPGRWKVTDFGIAKTDNYNLEDTASGMLMGTPAYLAPEHITSGQAQPASDLYALGVMLFEMITGTRPFTDPNPIRLLEKHLSVEAPAVSTLVAGLPPEIDAIVARSLAKTPADRWSTAGELRRALAEQLGPDASFEMPVAEIKAMARSQVIQPGRSGTTVPMGHMPPAKATGGVTSDGVKDATGIATVRAREASVDATAPRVSARPPARSRPQAQPAPPTKSAGVAPMAVLTSALIVVGALLWPRGGSVPPPPPPVPSPSPSAAARPRLPEWEIVKLRGELDGVIKDRASREGDLKLMAAHLMPAAQNFKEASAVARTLVKAEEKAYTTMQRVANRMAEEYGEPVNVPDPDALLYARIFACRARAWCWHENMRITLEVSDRMVERGGAAMGNDQALSEMEKRSYPPALLAPTFAAIDGISMALERCARQPALITDELGDLFLEINYVNINLSWRTWDPNVLKRVDQRVSRMRTLCAQLPPPVGPALGRSAMALWDLGSTPSGQLKLARDRVAAALDELAAQASFAPALTAVQRRVLKEVLNR